MSFLKLAIFTIILSFSNTALATGTTKTPTHTKSTKTSTPTKVVTVLPTQTAVQTNTHKPTLTATISFTFTPTSSSTTTQTDTPTVENTPTATATITPVRGWTINCVLHTNKYIKPGGSMTFRASPKLKLDDSIYIPNGSAYELSLPLGVTPYIIYPNPTSKIIKHVNGMVQYDLVWSQLFSPIRVKIRATVDATLMSGVTLVTTARMTDQYNIFPSTIETRYTTVR